MLHARVQNVNLSFTSSTSSKRKSLEVKTQQMWTVESCGLSDVGIDMFLGKGNGKEDLGKQTKVLNSISYSV